LVADGIDRRKLIAPFVRARRVNDGSRVKALALGRNGRIQWTAPAASQDIDILRLGAGRDRPNYIVRVIDIDIVVDDHDIATEIGTGAALTCDERRLLRMAGVALFNLDDGKEAI